MKKKTLQATSVRNALTFLIVTLIGASVVGFYYTQDWLNNMSDDINTSSASANPGDSSPQALAGIRSDIAKNKSSADKANSLLYSSVDYKNQMAKDISRYAANSSLTIKSIDTNQPAQTSSVSGNLKVGYAIVTPDGPVSMHCLLLFFKGIESNLPKMQVTGIDISKDQNFDGLFDVKPITIEGYFK